MDDIKKCSNSGILSLKREFHKKLKAKDGLTPHCKLCHKAYRKRCFIENYYLEIIRHKKYRVGNKGKINHYSEKKRELDVKFKLACNLKSRTNKAVKSQNIRKTNRTFHLLRCSHSISKNWIIHQFYGNMT